MACISPSVSVVTPSFNQAAYIEVAIQSVLDQKHIDLEYVVIDGLSSDGSADIIKKFDGRLHYWVSEPDAGQYEAINKGFARSTGEVMAWLNSDDMYCPWALRTVGAIFRDLPEVEWLTTLHPLLWTVDGQCAGFLTTAGISSESLIEGRHSPGCARFIGAIQQESTFWRRSLWEKVGGLDVSYRLAADHDLWLRFSRYAEPYSVAMPLGGARRQPLQRSLDMDKYTDEAIASLERLRREAGWQAGLLDRCRDRLIWRVRGASCMMKTYTGKRVELSDPRSPDSAWIVRQYRYKG